jgi:integrase
VPGRQERVANASAITAAKSYRLLRTILNTAVEDELIVRNPCTLKGAGTEHSRERDVANIAQVYALADAVEPRYRAMILLATFGGLRFGELAGLRRLSIDLLHSKVNVTEQLQRFSGGRMHVGPPKSAAGVRSISLPSFLAPELQGGMARHSLRCAGLTTSLPLRRRSA